MVVCDALALNWTLRPVRWRRGLRGLCAAGFGFGTSRLGKFAASLMGKTTERCRLPLAPPMGPTRERVRAAMTEVGLLN